MNVNDILKQIHVIYEGDDDAPADNDEDWRIRLALVNLAITEWEAQPNVNWSELIQVLEATIDVETNQYSLPDNFSRTLDGAVLLNGVVYTQISPQDRLQVASSGHYFCVTGNSATGYRLEFINTTLQPGDTLQVPYIKKAHLMASGSDIPELSDPSYIIHLVVGELCGQDSDPRTSQEKSISQSLLDQMVLRNETSGTYSADTYPTE